MCSLFLLFLFEISIYSKTNEEFIDIETDQMITLDPFVMLQQLPPYHFTISFIQIGKVLWEAKVTEHLSKFSMCLVLFMG